MNTDRDAERFRCKATIGLRRELRAIADALDKAGADTGAEFTVAAMHVGDVLPLYRKAATVQLALTDRGELALVRLVELASRAMATPEACAGTPWADSPGVLAFCREWIPTCCDTARHGVWWPTGLRTVGGYNRDQRRMRLQTALVGLLGECSKRVAASYCTADDRVAIGQTCAALRKMIESDKVRTVPGDDWTDAARHGWELLNGAESAATLENGRRDAIARQEFAKRERRREVGKATGRRATHETKDDKADLEKAVAHVVERMNHKRELKKTDPQRARRITMQGACEYAVKKYGLSIKWEALRRHVRSRQGRTV